MLNYDVLGRILKHIPQCLKTYLSIKYIIYYSVGHILDGNSIIRCYCNILIGVSSSLQFVDLDDYGHLRSCNYTVL